MSHSIARRAWQARMVCFAAREARLAAFPSVLLLAFAVITAMLWARPAIWRIAAAGAASAAAGLTLLRVYGSLPLTSQISVWRPVTLFGDGLLLMVDSPTWPAAFVLSLIPLVCLLSRVGARPMDGLETTGVVAMAGLGLTALFASNLLTLIVIWSLLGVCRLAWAILAGDGESSPTALIRIVPQEIAAALLLMLAGFLDQTAGGSTSLLSPPRSSIGAIVFLLAVLVRAAPVGALRGEGPSPSGRQVVTTLGFQVVPAVVALGSLGRVLLHGLPPEAFTAGAWLGLLAMLSGLRSWLDDAASKRRGEALPWILVGSGMLAACLTRSGEVALAMSVLLLLIGGLDAIQQVQRLWQRAWPALAFLAAAGAPALPGAGVVMQLEPLARSGLGGWILVAVAMAAVAAGLWLRAAGHSTAADTPAGAPVRGSDLAGLALLLSAVLVSLRQGWVGDLTSLGVAAGIMALGIVGIVVASRLPYRSAERTGTSLYQDLVRGGRQSAQATVTAAGQVVGAVAGLFEGRAGMLWMFLVVLATWLALRS